MRRSKLTTPFGLGWAALLVIAALFVGWLAVRSTARDMVVEDGGRVTPLVAGQPDVVLSAAISRMLSHRGRVDPHGLPAIRAAAARVPLDGRPYALIGSYDLQSGQAARGVTTLEAARRLNPRQRWVHLLLLEHYLRSGQYQIAAAEFAVLSRLVNDAQSPIATALAQMSIAPQTRDAVRTILVQDPGLEGSVLAALAASNVAPATIFRMATPAGIASADLPGGWGTVLIDRLVQKHRYHEARAVWQRINRLSDQQIATLLYDPALQQMPGKPPFNWKLASDNIAAVDMRGSKFNIDYYGRDSGDLVTQLLLLPPGTYRFSYVVSGVQQAPGSGSSVFWSLACANVADRSLARVALPAGANPRRLAFDVVVPADCPAQWLKLNGQAGEFPTPVSAVVENVQLEKVIAK